MDKPTVKTNSSKKKPKAIWEYFDYRNNQVNQIGLIFFVSFVIATSLHYFFEDRFSEERWKQSPMNRYEMIDDIIDRNLFINDTKREVIQQLGYPKESNYKDADQFNYYVGVRGKFKNGDIKQFTLFFRNNHVIKTAITRSKD
ncbi:hypothetical protein [Winogradskyella endarachnes]|uniref:Uncharacterized protein n=1 Tax=Winogradskyella endarachnes TaxID=2681965 RepID=A0A6L6U8F4_9FLAO|nr:hypothetical protein [Winogradskyella endarachnes]MUU78553.1 hypothetical protein [Winogradskyella endarachnes]